MKFTHKNILTITTCIALLFYCYGVNSWQYAAVGDDWPFYQFAKQIIAGHFTYYPFSFEGVFHQNSMLSSMYQALFMTILGPSNFSWRFSNLVLIIPISIFTYLWLKKVFNPNIALLSTIILQTSFYLANFFKVGKNMPQALALMMICLYWTVRSVDKPTKMNFFILGILLGVSFYIYIGPLFPFIIWPFFLPLLRRDKIKLLFSRGLFLMIGYGLLVMLSFINIGGINGPLGKTFAHREYEGYIPMINNIWHNFLLFFKNYDYIYNHFVAGPYMEVITAGLVAAGIITALIKVRQQSYLMLLLAYASLCVIMGIMSPYPYSPSTRGIFFIPFGAVFAGITLSYLVKKRYKYLLIPILLCIFGSNVYVSQIGVFKITDYSKTALLMKEFQQMQRSDEKQPIRVILPEGSRYYAKYFLPNMKEAYGLQNVDIKIIEINVLQCSELVNAKVLMIEHHIPLKNKYEELPCATKPKPIFLHSDLFI